MADHPAEPPVIRNEGGHTRRVGTRGLQIVEEMAANGCSETSIAKQLRVAASTFREIKKRQPEVCEALDRGYSSMEDALVSRLYRTALGDTPGAVTAAIFLLKARRGYEGTRTPAHITINDNRQQTIQLPSKLDMDEYRRRYLPEAQDA
ncbi:MAG: hypothetical protein AAF607_00725 [Pseudomonadota bacterium]